MVPSPATLHPTPSQAGPDPQTIRMHSRKKPSGILPCWPSFLALAALTVVVSPAIWLTSAWAQGASPSSGKSAVQKPANVLAPRVAGSFYPQEVEEIRRQVSGFMSASPVLGLRGVRAVIVPHAGYVFSGAVAAHAFRELGSTAKTVFILADNHNGEANYTGVSFPNAGAMEVAGVQIPLSPICWQLAAAAPDLFCQNAAAHESHMIEVELPFILAARQWPAKPDFEIVPLVLSGNLSDEQMAKLTDLLNAQAKPDSLFVVSTDLSHYQGYNTARQWDYGTIGHMLAKEGDELTHLSCCGLQSVRTVLNLASKQNWETNRLFYDNSATASGDTQRVVGYTAIALTEPLSFTPEEQKALLDYARKVVETKVRTGVELAVEENFLKQFPIFRLNRAVFVTLKENGQLRGCIGSLTNLEPIHESVRGNAINAALHDPRFSPVTAEELDKLNYTISILTFPARVKAQPADFTKVLRPRRDGVILAINGRQSTFLPEVWEEIPEPTEFLGHLCRKQGSQPEAWKSSDAVMYTYTAFVMHEGK